MIALKIVTWFSNLFANNSIGIQVFLFFGHRFWSLSTRHWCLLWALLPWKFRRHLPELSLAPGWGISVPDSASQASYCWPLFEICSHSPHYFFLWGVCMIKILTFRFFMFHKKVLGEDENGGGPRHRWSWLEAGKALGCCRLSSQRSQRCNYW